MKNNNRGNRNQNQNRPPRTRLSRVIQMGKMEVRTTDLHDPALFAFLTSEEEKTLGMRGHLNITGQIVYDLVEGAEAALSGTPFSNREIVKVEVEPVYANVPIEGGGTEAVLNERETKVSFTIWATKDGQLRRECSYEQLRRAAEKLTHHRVMLDVEFGLENDPEGTFIAALAAVVKPHTSSVRKGFEERRKARGKERARDERSAPLTASVGEMTDAQKAKLARVSVRAAAGQKPGVAAKARAEKVDLSREDKNRAALEAVRAKLAGGTPAATPEAPATDPAAQTIDMTAEEAADGTGTDSATPTE
jgi:hypothetical protein